MGKAGVGRPSVGTGTYPRDPEPEQATPTGADAVDHGTEELADHRRLVGHAGVHHHLEGVVAVGRVGDGLGEPEGSLVAVPLAEGNHPDGLDRSGAESRRGVGQRSSLQVVQDRMGGGRIGPVDQQTHGLQLSVAGRARQGHRAPGHGARPYR